LQIESRGVLPSVLAEAGLIDATEHITDFADTAALMAELDLIITVDTAAAHLAGALGRPVWTLLPVVPDWRWGLEREDTPWYPTMRLFRQRAPGDWDGVIQRVAAALVNL
jgi:ADP-heptose:LPS heptosyltransferase